MHRQQGPGPVADLNVVLGVFLRDVVDLIAIGNREAGIFTDVPGEHP